MASAGGATGLAMKKAWIVAALIGLVLPAGYGWAARPARSLTPLVLGWEQFFKLEWQAAERAGQPVVQGYILNDWGFPARRIQLLVEALDDTGGVAGQQVAWLGSSLTPGTRAYFEVPVARRAPTYRVSVFAFEWVQVGDGDRL